MPICKTGWKRKEEQQLENTEIDQEDRKKM